MYVLNNIIYPYLLKKKLILLIYLLIILIIFSLKSIIIPHYFLKSVSLGKNQLYIYIIILFSYIVINYFKNKNKNKFLIKIGEDNRYSVIENLFINLSNHYKEHSEAIITYIIERMYDVFFDLTSYIFEDFIPYIINTIIIFVLILYYNKRIALLFLITNIIIVGIFYTNVKNIIKRWDSTEKYFNKHLIEDFGDKIKNLSTIIFDNNLETELSDLDRKTHTYDNLRNHSSYYTNNKIFILKSILYIFFIICLYILIKSKLLKKDKLFILFVLMMYINLTTEILNNLIDTFFINYIRLLDINEVLTQENDNVQCEPIKDVYSLYFENVSFKYKGSNNYIIKDLTLKIEPKKMNVIMGKSGSGKTTIMKLIVKMLKPTSGIIYANDVDMATLCDNDIRNNIYYVNQRTILFNDTVINNFKYGNNSKNKKIINLLEKYDLLSYFDTLDKGVKSQGGHNGSNLSLGMQKIIMVIRGILKENKNIIIFDEPLTSLDKESRKKIIELIVHETKGKTLIIITHDKEILPYADNVVHLKSIN